MTFYSAWTLYNKQSKKSILVGIFLSLLMFLSNFSIIGVYKVIGISIRHFKYDERGLAIFLVKNVSGNGVAFVL